MIEEMDGSEWRVSELNTQMILNAETSGASNFARRVGDHEEDTYK